MSESVQNRIKGKLNNMPTGSIVFISDFSDIGTDTAVVVCANVAPTVDSIAVNPTSINEEESTTLTATVDSGSNVTYTWDLGDGMTDSGAVVTHIYPDISLYTAVVTATNRANSISATTDVTIFPIPVTGDNKIYLPIVKR